MWIMRLRSVSAREFWRYVFPATSCLGRLAQFGRNTMRYYLYHQPFCCALLGMLLYEKLHFSAVATVAACMVSAIALPWLFGKLIRLCRLDDIFKKIGLPA